MLPVKVYGATGSISGLKHDDLGVGIAADLVRQGTSPPVSGPCQRQSTIPRFHSQTLV